MRKLSILLCFLLLLIPLSARADEEGDAVYEILDESGASLTFYAGVPQAGDEYITHDNRHYRITRVDAQENKAYAAGLGAFPLPDVSWDEDGARPVARIRHAIALYCTHSDESYESGDGKSSIDKGGGIYDVAEQLKKNLENKGVTVYYSDENHFPHDAGAYRRSRATAASLKEEGVDAIFDIHRDGIPDAGQYESEINGKDVTKVRLLVGRANQNSDANRNFAAQIKAVADKRYPGLIKDIYIGKGTYNQDLMPQAVLLEFGTHKSDKSQVLASTALMADVLDRALYGGVTGAAGKDSEKNPGAYTGIAWLLGLMVAGMFVYALLATGSRRAAFEKWKGNFREMTGGLLGRRRR